MIEEGWADDLLHCWFDELTESDWFGVNNTVDAMLRIRFGAVLAAQSGLPASAFLGSARVAQAAILLFDQIPRNVHRGTPLAFATDPLARAICKHFLAAGWDKSLPDAERQFIAMPLMHSEDLADQEESLAYFGAHLPANLEFARSHHAMIARFGRFPHRNAVLGRTSSTEELRAIAEGFSW